MVLFPLSHRDDQPLVSVRGMVPECHTAVKTTYNPWIMASHPALSNSALMLRIPAAIPLLNFATGSLASSMEVQFCQWMDQHSASVIQQFRTVFLEDLL